MVRRRVRSISAIMVGVLVGALAGGCGDATGPGGLAGAYRLERYEGREIPAVVTQTNFGSVSIVGERILLGDDGNSVVFTTIREVNEVTPQGNTLSYTRAFDYVVRDGRIEITYECPPLADCLAGPHTVGELVGGGLALGAPASSKPASIYSRVR